jgi:hypothetical protein
MFGSDRESPLCGLGTSEPLVEAAVLEKPTGTHPLRNEAPLYFVALRSTFDCLGSSDLSRVEMNALAGALDSSLEPVRMRVPLTRPTTS